MAIRRRGQTLTPLQERFCREYIIDLEGKAAAIRAGYKAQTAKGSASELLQKPHVRAYIEQLKARQFKRIEVRADNVLRELGCIAFVDPIHVIDHSGFVLPLDQIPEDVRRAIASMEVEFGRVTKIKFWPKSHALDTLGKHFKLWVDRLEVSGRVDIADALREARARRLKAMAAPGALPALAAETTGGTPA